MRTLSSAIAAALLAISTSLSAQTAAPRTGPGVALGIVAYKCASCGFEQTAGGRQEYSFQAEPVVTEIAPGSLLRVGDVILSVNGQPITTRAGADEFTYPKVDRSTVKVRRNGNTITLSTTLVHKGGSFVVWPSETFSIHADSVKFFKDMVKWFDVTPTFAFGKNAQLDSVKSWKITADPKFYVTMDSLRSNIASFTYWLDTLKLKTPSPKFEIKFDSLRTTVSSLNFKLDSLDPKRGSGRYYVRMDSLRNSYNTISTLDELYQWRDAQGATRTSPSGLSTGTGVLGFAISCNDDCVMSIANGEGHWTFKTPPSVVAIVANSIAAKTGLKSGDKIIDVDGVSVLEDAGAIKLSKLGSPSPGSATRTIERGGKRQKMNFSWSGNE